MNNLSKLQETIGYQFKDPSLLATSLTHRSSLNEPDVKESNERLEFLGDAVLELIVTNFLFHQKPNEPEGVLTSARSAIVRTETLAKIAKSINLGEYLKMSRGEASSGGRDNPSILEDAFESLTGAIYEDGGLPQAKQFIEKILFPFAQEILSKGDLKDAKSRLQEIVQAKGLISPIYQVISQVGPDHNKIFTVTVLVDSKPLGQGSGKSKQEAEQAAAQKALDLI